MLVDIAKEDLQYVRDAIYDRRDGDCRTLLGNRHLSLPAKDKAKGTKLIKKLNQSLKKAYGHDCGGVAYV